MSKADLDRFNNFMVEYKEDIIAEYEKQLQKKDNEIEKLNNIINNLDKLIEHCSKRDYYFKYNGKYLKSEIINDLKTIIGVDKPRKGEVVSLEELESYEPKNSIEEEYYDEMWS